MTNQPPYYQQNYDPQSGGPIPYPSYYAAVPMKHSGMGVASFVIAISMVLLELAMVVLAAVLVQQKTPSNSPAMEIAGCSMILGLAVCVIGVILGIIGVNQSDRKKLFAILGLCINGMILLGVLGLMVIGLAMKK